METTAEEDTRHRLLTSVKKEVKQLMEEAVTRKFVHEESSTITALCAAVEACLQNGLKKRALGLFKNSTTTTALLQKLSKHSDDGAHIVKLLNELENNNDPSKRSLDSSRTPTQRRSLSNQKYVWIKLALFEKKLHKIIEHLVDNCSKFYEKEALISDPCDGPLLASLLVGPCALDYTRMKTTDHFWTDPPADELVQRHRIHAGSNHHMSRPESPKRPGLQVSSVKAQIRRNTSSSSEESMRTVPLSAKEYVESLHQNSRSTLLYGKNSVMVQPKEDVACLAGYLSLHQGPEGLTVKWTPNQLMNGCCEEQASDVDRSLYWDYAVTIFMDEIVYLHCHQQPDSGGTIVLVGQDGVQRPPIHFPNGGHLLAFLTCLETGLLPHGQLDPPLWAQKGKGKVFPKLKRKGSRLTSTQSQSSVQRSATEDLVEEPTNMAAIAAAAAAASNANSNSAAAASNGASAASKPMFSTSLSVNEDTNSVSVDETNGTINEEEEATDYVFRIINTFKPESLPEEMMDPEVTPSKDKLSSIFPWIQREILNSKPLTQLQQPASVVIETIHQYTQSHGSGAGSGASTTATRQQPQHQSSQDEAMAPAVKGALAAAHSQAAVKQLCDTMKKQIISRAFYGWLAHCRHLKTVRTHLSGLVNTNIIAVKEKTDSSNGLTVEKWRELCVDGVVKNESEVDRLVYYGGCAHAIRKEVWPYLLGHYTYGSTPDEREDLDEDVKTEYEQTMSEWLAVEAIVRQRDKEIMAANLAKLSSESQDHGVGGPPGVLHGAGGGSHIPLMRKDSSLSNDVFESVEHEDPVVVSAGSVNRPDPLIEESGSSAATSPNTADQAEVKIEHTILRRGHTKQQSTNKDSPDEGLGDSISRGMSTDEHPASSSASISLVDTHQHNGHTDDGAADAQRECVGEDSVAAGGSERGRLSVDRNIIVTNPSMDSTTGDEPSAAASGDGVHESNLLATNNEMLSASRDSLNISAPPSPASVASNGGVYSMELLDSVALNLHRIDKDVQRCDRNYPYFTPANLDKLRNIMCTYVWEQLDVGYVQGMCDLVAPLLVIFDDEAKTYSCFKQLMKRMMANFPHGGAMDTHFANMRSLIQILDAELFEHMHQNGDYTHFYFCYRWFLLDFKRELVYDDVFSVWETIWSARRVSSNHFVLFIALALVQYYREIILDNAMDFTDIIKFFNEMAERHNAKQVLKLARDLVYKLQDLIENK